MEFLAGWFGGMLVGIVGTVCVLFALIYRKVIVIQTRTEPLAPMAAEEEFDIVDPNEVHSMYESQQAQANKDVEQGRADYEAMVERALKAARTTRGQGGSPKDPMEDL